ncbi:hypothetical protein CCP3SC15_420029 [Gammaproteobacteria bacterium]
MGLWIINEGGGSRISDLMKGRDLTVSAGTLSPLGMSGAYASVGSIPYTGGNASFTAVVRSRKTATLDYYAAALAIGQPGTDLMAYLGQGTSDGQSGGGIYGSLNAGSGTVWAVGTTHTIALVHTASPAWNWVYVDGAQIFSGASDTLDISGGVYLNRMGSSESFDFTGTTELAMIYDYALNATQVKSICENPYQIIHTSRTAGHLYAAAAAGGSTLPVFMNYYRQARA